MIMIRTSTTTIIALILAILGGLNLGILGVFGVDMIAVVAGPMSVLARVLYTLIGIAAFVLLVEGAFAMERRSIEQRSKEVYRHHTA
jgi:uncharacterized membrane protein YuzA (DUF378 family)